MTKGISNSTVRFYSEECCKNGWAIFCEKMSPQWVIIEDLSRKSFKQLVEEKLNNPVFYKGIFKLFNFNDLSNGYEIKFIMTQIDIPIGRIKHEIGRIANIDPKKISICFAGKNLKDTEDLQFTCGWNGRDQEKFSVFIPKLSPSSRSNLTELDK